MVSINQFGFRKNISNTNPINETLHYIYDNPDNDKSDMSVFLDFTEAFDYVDHKILLQKTNMYSDRGQALVWIRSYLTQCKQYVSINDINSRHCLIEYGAPRGSIPGSILFLIFNNDFPKSYFIRCSQLILLWLVNLKTSNLKNFQTQ